MRFPGSSSSTNRHRLTILLATVAALLLVPAAQAFANGTVTVKIAAGSGSGKVSSVEGFGAYYEEPPEFFKEAWNGTPPIECSGPPASGTCTNEMELNEIDEEWLATALYAIPDPGSELSGWTVEGSTYHDGTHLFGGCSENLEEATTPEVFPRCFVAEDPESEDNVVVTATFECETEGGCKPPNFPLAISKAGTGSGTVTCNGGACAASYPEGEEVTLAASAASGSTFAGWSGGGCTGTGNCVVTIEAETTVTATFTANPPPPTCATDPSLCPPPPPPAEGKAKAAGTASVKGGKAELKLACAGGPCKGTVQLTAKVKQGKKTKSLVIGKASFSLADGATTTLKVKLSGAAKQELAKGKTLKAKAGGTDVSASTVKLKPAKK